jgi:hypothetical protein
MAEDEEMKQIFATVFCLIVMSCQSQPGRRFETRDTNGMQWFKGNIHTHAREGESDSPVETVARWYKDHGYRFLVITDHSTITFPEALYGLADSTFLPIPGEEITGYGNRDDLEINGLNLRHAVPPQHDSTLSGALQKCIDAVRRENAVPVINHPNYKWRLDQETLSGVERCGLFEVYNAFPGTGNEGDDGHPGLEQVWDLLLTSGKRFYGVAADDAHAYQSFSPELSNPGRAWVMVRAEHLDAEEIMKNLDSGLFYSSTGVEIEDVRIKPHRIEIVIKKTAGSEYATEFIGSGGKLLAATKDNPAVYDLGSEDIYVRARITDAIGSRAWIQPVFVVR